MAQQQQQNNKQQGGNQGRGNKPFKLKPMKMLRKMWKLSLLPAWAAKL